jgi:hypothetical protein
MDTNTWPDARELIRPADSSQSVSVRMRSTAPTLKGLGVRYYDAEAVVTSGFVLTNRSRRTGHTNTQIVVSVPLDMGEGWMAESRERLGAARAALGVGTEDAHGARP